MEQPEIDRRSMNGTVRRHRIVQGAGGGTAIGASIAIIVGWVYQMRAGDEIPAEVGLALGAVIGSLSSTIAICLKDIRALLWAAVLRRRDTDRGGKESRGNE